MPEISVVIPTRNRWRLLDVCGLRSALGQEGVDHEVIVVDDGSTDETAARLSSVDDPRLRILHHEAPAGMAKARNTGIAAARAEWIAFLDDDDLWSPRKLATQLATARATGADFVYAATVAVDERSTVLEQLYHPPAQDLREKLSHACVIPAGPSNVIARADLLRSLGGFDESFVHVADWDLWIRLADAGTPAVCDDVLVAYHRHGQNIHVVDDPSDEIDALVRKHASRVSPGPVEPDRVGHSRWLAGQRSRAGLHRDAAHVYLKSAVRYRSLGNLVRAVDALLGKRISRTIRSLSGREPAPQHHVASPDWLRAYAE